MIQFGFPECYGYQVLTNSCLKETAINMTITIIIVAFIFGLFFAAINVLWDMLLRNKKMFIRGRKK